ncbi:extracellular solute-binding protein [Bacillus sp. JCM 19041]|uniref:extracellular solute-binding protein n=1 Tax=Bacillus sp. JCM 19041 TaxID=1460637 RepID=UPI0006D08F8F
MLDVTDRVAASDVIDLDKIWESGTERYTINDRIYALPKDVGPFGYAFNKDLFDEAGVEYPNPDDPYDWNEYIEVATKLTLDVDGNNADHPDFDQKSIAQYGAGFWWLNRRCTLTALIGSMRTRRKLRWIHQSLRKRFSS